jgi:hypothetical protein
MYAKNGLPFVNGNMDGDTCVITNNLPPGKPPGKGGARRKRSLPTINTDKFDIDFIPYWSLQDKPVLVLFL